MAIRGRCCSCSQTGRCCRCACVKAGNSCSNCIPLRLGNCQNVSPSSFSSNSASSSNSGGSSAILSASTSGSSTISSGSSTSSGSSVSSGSSTSTSSGSSAPSGSMPSCEPSCDPQPSMTSLPSFASLPSNPVFSWGSADETTIIPLLDKIYKEVVGWRKNFFRVPFGGIGKRFVSALARQFFDYANCSNTETICLKAAMVLPSLLLQRPHPKSKNRENASCLERRLIAWEDGQLSVLYDECIQIQNRLRPTRPPTSDNNRRATVFANLVFQGKIKDAMRLLDSSPSVGRILYPSDPSGQDDLSVLDCLRSKHPQAQYTHGSAGPSGVDAAEWRRLCSSFKKSSDDLCSSLAAVARRLCSDYVDPVGLAPFVAGRLIALDKNPGVRPIGVGEVSRRIIGKAILRVIGSDIQESAGSIQLCAGQIGGCESAIHAARSLFSEPVSEGLLMVDATNAFNSVNRKLALVNISHICPSFSKILINTYRDPISMFIDGESVLSTEGTTQGDPLAMGMYALAILPLIHQLHDTAKQVWYADDAAACDSLSRLRHWWDSLNNIGPSYGYFPNPRKTYLLVKPEYFDEATSLFNGSMVNITDTGHRYLGSAIGSDEYVNSFVEKKVETWNTELLNLVDFANSQPHASFSVLTHGLFGKWAFLARTTPNIAHLYQPLETTIRTKLLPVLLGQGPPCDSMRDLLSLPARLGGMGVTNPMSIAADHYYTSSNISQPLVDQIIGQSLNLSTNTLCAQLKVKADLKNESKTKLNEKFTHLCECLSSDMRNAVSNASEKGASSWLTVIPLRSHNFVLYKSAFRDAIALRYGWPPTRLPSKCVCGSDFTVEHAFSCARGGLPCQRHNELRDFTTSLMSDVCTDVKIEPDLQPLSGESLHYRTAITDDEARLDVRAAGFWGCRSTRDYFDVRVFNPLAKSYRNKSADAVYKQLEQLKRRAYDQRIREIEHGTFTPLIFSATGGLGKAAHETFSRLASLLSEKWGDHYNQVIRWLRCHISFSLLRSAINCIRGSRSLSSPTFDYHSISLALVESRLTT